MPSLFGVRSIVAAIFLCMEGLSLEKEDRGGIEDERYYTNSPGRHYESE